MKLPRGVVLLTTIGNVLKGVCRNVDRKANGGVMDVRDKGGNRGAGTATWAEGQVGGWCFGAEPMRTERSVYGGAVYGSAAMVVVFTAKADREG